MTSKRAVALGMALVGCFTVGCSQTPRGSLSVDSEVRSSQSLAPGLARVYVVPRSAWDASGLSRERVGEASREFLRGYRVSGFTPLEVKLAPGRYAVVVERDFGRRQVAFVEARLEGEQVVVEPGSLPIFRFTDLSVEGGAS